MANPNHLVMEAIRHGCDMWQQKVNAVRCGRLIRDTVWRTCFTLAHRFTVPENGASAFDFVTLSEYASPRVLEGKATAGGTSFTPSGFRRYYTALYEIGLFSFSMRDCVWVKADTATICQVEYLQFPADAAHHDSVNTGLWNITRASLGNRRTCASHTIRRIQQKPRSTIRPVRSGSKHARAIAQPQPLIRERFYGSFNTFCSMGAYDTGTRNPISLLTFHRLSADGYQTFNFQQRSRSLKTISDHFLIPL